MMLKFQCYRTYLALRHIKYRLKVRVKIVSFIAALD